MRSAVSWMLGTVALACSACGPAPPVSIEIPCRVAARAPYPAGSTYRGVHANPENNDVVACASGSAFTPMWHALEGLAMSQPNTFSPDGSVTYAATFNPMPGGCTVHAVRVDDGSVLWCRSLPASVGGSAVEVDADGNLYVTYDRFVASLGPDGTDRWSTPVAVEGGADFGDGPLGVHFTVGGNVATVTSDGVVVLLDRGSGAILARLDLPLATGFVPPMALTGLDLGSLLPEGVRADLVATFGTASGGNGLAAFLGASGRFSDNTVAISSRSQLFVTGGGPDPMHGALLQVHVTEASGETPALTLGWSTVTNAGSAASPSISFDGRWVSVGDGASVNAILNPAGADAHLYVMDVDACDANLDLDPDAARCAPSYAVELLRGPIAGSPPLLPDGSLLFWELSVSQGLFPADARDVAFASPDGRRWETTLPDGLEWTSVMTVTDDHILGTSSTIEPGSERIVTVRLPSHVESFLTVLDRGDGHLVFRAPVPDDSTATVTIGPDGSLFVGMFGLLSILASEDHPTLGLLRFAPTAR